MGSNHSKSARPTPSSSKEESTASNNSDDPPSLKQDLSSAEITEKSASLSDQNLDTTSTYPSAHRDHRASPLKNLPGNRSCASVLDCVRRYDQYVNLGRSTEEATAGNADEGAAVLGMGRGTGMGGGGGLEPLLSNEEHQSSLNVSTAPRHNISPDVGPSNEIADVPAEYAVASVGTSGVLYTSQRNNSSESGSDFRRAWIDLYGHMPLDGDGYEMDMVVERQANGSFKAQLFKIPPPPREVGNEEGWTVYSYPSPDSEVRHAATVKRPADEKQAEARKCGGEESKGKGEGGQGEEETLEKQRKTKKEVGNSSGVINLKDDIAETNEAENKSFNHTTKHNRQALLRNAHFDRNIQKPGNDEVDAVGETVATADDAAVGVKVHSAEMHAEAKLPQLLRDVCLDGTIGLGEVAVELLIGEETEGQEDTDNMEPHPEDEMEDGEGEDTDVPEPTSREQVMKIMRRFQLDGIIGLDVAANVLSDHEETTEDTADPESPAPEMSNLPCGRDLDPAEVLGLLRKLHLDEIIGLDLISASTIQNAGECGTEKVELEGTRPEDDPEDTGAPKRDNLRQLLRLLHLDGIVGLEIAAGEPSHVHESERIADLEETELSMSAEHELPNLLDPEEVLVFLRRLQLDGIISLDIVSTVPAYGEEAVWTEEFASIEVTSGDDLKDPGLVELDNLQ